MTCSFKNYLGLIFTFCIIYTNFPWFTTQEIVQACQVMKTIELHAAQVYESKSGSMTQANV
jgi:hypothetical protein